MLDSEGSAVASTGNLNAAVALATFGFPYRLERLRDEPTSEVVSCLWHFATRPVLYSKAHPEEPMPHLTSQTVLRQLRSGELQQADPAHPILDVLEALNIFERLRSYMVRAVLHRIVPTRAPGRYMLIDGAEPAGDVPRPSCTTDSTDLAVALVRMGHPLLGCTGSPPHTMITIGRDSFEPGAPSATDLAQGINSGELHRTNPGHPALWAIVGQRNRRAMLAELKRDTMPMLLRNPRSLSWERRHRSVIAPGGVTGRQIDRAREHL